jgi:SAM-dependent MidA family methyltransferase
MSFLHYFHRALQGRDCMPFVEFMQHALYAPTVGYYSTRDTIFGLHGDFVTAPELTPLFGYTLANQCAAMLADLPEPSILEFGAGSGQLCIDVLTRLKQLHQLPQHYYILELSASLQALQKANIHAALPEYSDRVQWLSRFPDQPFAGILLANEVLDAMPVHRFLTSPTGLLESQVSLSGETLHETFAPSDNPRLLAHVQQLPPLSMGYLSEANLFIDGWLQQCAACLTQGAMLIIDYGFPQHEYYHPDRAQGTLMCHAQHTAHANPFANPGREDMTAHVDFTHVADAALKAGFHVNGFTNQASFLLGNNLLSLLGDIQDETARLQASACVKRLVQPHEMGELFKVIALTKHLDVPLAGFQFYDQRARL